MWYWIFYSKFNASLGSFCSYQVSFLPLTYGGTVLINPLLYYSDNDHVTFEVVAVVNDQYHVKQDNVVKATIRKVHILLVSVALTMVSSLFVYVRPMY
jgi:hypothetical protein